MKIYTVSDLCEISGLSRMGIFGRARRIGIKPFQYAMEKTSKGNSIRISLFSAEQAEKMGLLNTSEKKIEKKEVKPAVKISLEEMKALHPLVTDENFLRLSFFPDVSLGEDE